MNGATCYVEYEIPTSTIDHYTYTFEVSEDATIAVTIGSGGGQITTMYIKVNGSWVAANQIYKKINGNWVEQTNLINVFDSNVNYKKG